jgi:MIP family channel proteins
MTGSHGEIACRIAPGDHLPKRHASESVTEPRDGSSLQNLASHTASRFDEILFTQRLLPLPSLDIGFAGGNTLFQLEACALRTGFSSVLCSVLMRVLMPMPSFKPLVAEAIGTFWIVFAGTGAVIVQDLTGSVTPVGIGLTFGLVVLAMILAVGDVSGAHFNPAVTFGLFVAQRFPVRRVVPYWLAQIAGAFLASGILWTLFPTHPSLGSTLPSGSWQQAWVLELLLTFGLMFVILTVTTGAADQRALAAVAIGGVIALEAMFAGPISGASMNPARSLAPAVVSGQWQHLWVYLTAPCVGAVVGVLACSLCRETGCCSGSADVTAGPQTQEVSP